MIHSFYIEFSVQYKTNETQSKIITLYVLYNLIIHKNIPNNDINKTNAFLTKAFILCLQYVIKIYIEFYQNNVVLSRFIQLYDMDAMQ